MKFGILVFPGSGGETDCFRAVEETTGQSVEYVWHTSSDLSAYDGLIIAGCSSYGDYLRHGALANKAKAIEALKKEAQQCKYILGIGNGFQILLEAGLLPGAVLMNASQKFLCQQVSLRVVNPQTPFTKDYDQDEMISLPIAHRTGN